MRIRWLWQRCWQEDCKDEYETKPQKWPEGNKEQKIERDLVTIRHRLAQFYENAV